jgi:methionine biosynthesis protein MetW
MDEGTAPGASLAPPGPGRLEVRIHRSPRDSGHSGYGGTRKAAFEYARLCGLDIAIHMRAGLHPPELLPDLVYPLLADPWRITLASRWVRRLEAWRAGLPLVRLLAHTATTEIQNRLLGLRLRDYHSSYRAFPMRVVERIPFQLNANHRSFDTEMLIQCRALGLDIHEVSAPPDWREYRTDSAGLRSVLRGIGTSIDYRLHQLHLTRRGQYFVDTGVHYTLKRSATGSHMQIAEQIKPGSRVLDLGCSQGLLARPLREKRVSVTGVDAAPQERLAAELEAFHRRELEQPLELPTGRAFDYVVVSDVIEHLGNRNQLLRNARRYLKEGGRLIISTPNIALWFYRFSLLVGRFEYGPRGVLDHTHVHLFTRATFRREVEKAGFHVLGERVTALPFEVVFESTGRSRLVRSLARFYHLLARLWPELFAYQFILEAEITTLDEESVSP